MTSARYHDPRPSLGRTIAQALAVIALGVIGLVLMFTAALPPHEGPILPPGTTLPRATAAFVPAAPR